MSALSSLTVHRVCIPTLLNFRFGQFLNGGNQFRRIQRPTGSQSPAERLAGDGSAHAPLRRMYVGTATGALTLKVRQQPALNENNPEQISLMIPGPAADTRPYGVG